LNTTNKTNERGKKFFHLNQKGIIFSTDAIISFIIALLTTMIFVLYLSNIVLMEERKIEQIELDEKAIFIIDSMVKNQNEENALLGACNYEISKKRVLTNNLNYLQIKTNSKPLSLGNFFVKTIAITFVNTNQKETIMLSEEISKNCINVKRFALIDGFKAIIEVKTCKSEKL
jgi:hypothetical protein